jgi:hypothetical protein
MKMRLGWRASALQGLAVLVGILVAFGIEASWSSRGERLAVSASLSSLLAEVLENRDRLEARLARLSDNAARTEAYLLDMASAPSGSVPQDSLRRMIGALGPLRVDPLVRSAFDDLLSGGLRSIDDAEVRRHILAYGQAIAWDEELQRALTTWFQTRAEPYFESEGDLAGMRSLSPGWSGGEDIRFQMNPDAFLRSRRYANLLTARYLLLRNSSAAVRLLAERADELVALLETR